MTPEEKVAERTPEEKCIDHLIEAVGGTEASAVEAMLMEAAIRQEIPTLKSAEMRELIKELSKAECDDPTCDGPLVGSVVSADCGECFPCRARQLIDEAALKGAE